MIACPHCLHEFEWLLTEQAKGRLCVLENVVTEVHRASDGTLVEILRNHNLVVDAGLNLLRDLLDATNTAITHFRAGTSSTAPANGQTDLIASVHGNVVSQRVKASFAITHRCFIPSSAANGNTLREAGLFNALTGGTMFSRVTHDDIVKTASNTVTHSWTHTLARG